MEQDGHVPPPVEAGGVALCGVLTLLDPLLYFPEASLIKILKWKTYLMIFSP